MHDCVIPKDHFFGRLNERVDWQNISRGWPHRHKRAERPTVLKMFLVGYLDNLSKRQVEELANESQVLASGHNYLPIGT